MTHDPTDFTNPPRRRVGALALIREPGGDALLVEKSYRTGPERWGPPGGCAKAGETALDACRREVAEETGLTIELGHLLVVHHMPATNDATEGINFIYDGGTIPSDTVITLSPELDSYRWVPASEIAALAAPYTAWRMGEALGAAFDGAGISYLVGHTPESGTASAA